jgi:4'-phosphopantetheinyl transferase
MLAFRPLGASDQPMPLHVNGLHLWRIQARAGGADLAKFWSLLSLAERDRAGHLVTELLRGRYVRTHGCLRLILCKYLNTSPQHIVFARSIHGKPSVVQTSLDPTRRIQFSLADSDDLALVAVGRGDPLGVDCERIRPRRELLGIARRMFSVPVADALERAPEAQRLEGFYAAWTVLEAQVKADGRGLFRSAEPAAAPLATTQFRPRPGYLAAVARGQLLDPALWQCYEWSDGP